MNLANLRMRKVSCGLFGVSEDHFDGYLSLDERFIKNRTASFFFEVHGNSMEPSIFEKDILLVDRSLNVKSGQVVVVSLEGGFICKRLFKTIGGVVLKADNSSFQDVHITKEMDMIVFGVVVCVVRDLYGSNVCSS